MNPKQTENADQNPVQSPTSPAPASSPAAPPKTSDVSLKTPETPDSPAAETLDSKPKTQDLASGRHRRKGKVANLPKAIRDQINIMLSDGLTYLEIIAALGEPGQDLNEDNLGNWKSGGHQDWLKEQQRVEDCRISQELTFDLAREREGIDSFQAPNKIASALICEALADVGADTFRKALAEPQTALRLLNTLSRITTAGIKCERHLSAEAERRAAQKSGTKQGGIPRKSRTRIEQEFRLFGKNPNQSEAIRGNPNQSEADHLSKNFPDPTPTDPSTVPAAQSHDPTNPPIQ